MEWNDGMEYGMDFPAKIQQQRSHKTYTGLKLRLEKA